VSEIGSPAEPSFAALVGDLAGSRHLADRAGVQRSLRDAIARINRKLDPAEAASRLTLTAGDEVQILLRRPSAAVAIMIELAETVAPGRMVFGLGWGAVSTDLDPDPAVLDGPCFHAARTALRRARREGRWAVAGGFGAGHDPTLSALFALLGAVRARWTEVQLRYVRGARTSLQKEVAARYGVSPSVVSESLKAASFAVVREGERAAEGLLGQFGTKGELNRRSALEENP